MLMQPDANDTYNAKKPSRTYNRKEDTNTEVSSESKGTVNGTLAAPTHIPI